MIVRKLRLQKAWSQEQLAQMSGLSVRTIQRIERGQACGLESIKSLAAVFQVPVTDLTEQDPEDSQKEQDMPATAKLADDEALAIQQVKDLKSFYSHLIKYLIIIAGLFIVNFLTSPDYIWAWWAALGWGIGVISHALSVFEVFNFFGAQWEKKQVEKKLGRKL
jgi:transcriptional regulator with XRE-family HTH domain